MKYESDRRSSHSLRPLLRERRLSCLYVAAVSGVRAALMPDTALSAGTGTDLSQNRHRGDQEKKGV